MLNLTSINTQRIGDTLAQTCNWNAALKRLDDDIEIMEMMTSMFIEEYPDYLDNITNALNKQDWKLLGRELHTLKGVCSSVGAEKATALIQNAELLIQNNQLSEIKPLIKATKQETDYLIEILNAKLTCL